MAYYCYLRKLMIYGALCLGLVSCGSGAVGVNESDLELDSALDVLGMSPTLQHPGDRYASMVDVTSVQAVDWSPDGRWVAYGKADGGVRIIDVESKEVVHTLNGHTNIVKSVKWSPEGDKLASTGVDNTVVIWDVNAWVVDLVYPPRYIDFFSVDWSPDGKRVVTGSFDHAVQVWDADSGEEEFEMQGLHRAFNSVNWSSDGTMIAAGGVDKVVFVWGIGDEVELLYSFDGFSDSIWSVAFSPDSKELAVGDADGNVQIFDLENGTSRPLGVGRVTWVYELAWSPDGKDLALGASDGSVRVWNVETEDEVILGRHDKWVYSVSWSPDGGRIVSGSWDGTVEFWDVP